MEKITNLACPTTFWMSSDSNILRIVYLSYTSKDLSMVADINLRDKCYIIYDKKDSNSIICRFVGSGCSFKDFRKMNTTGCDLSIINNAREIISDDNLKIHVESALFYHFSYIDVSLLSAEEVANYMNSIGLAEVIEQPYPDRNNLYCGITNDLDRRMEEHRNNDFEIAKEKVLACVCRNADVAKEVESLMRDNNYDIGGNPGAGGGDDSSIVYLLKKRSIAGR